MQIRDDGSDRRRNEKVADLADRPDILNHLRVCWLHTGRGLNCGSCEKCLRTMMCLKMNGVLEHANFNAPLTPEKVAAIRLWGGGGDFMWGKMLDEMKTRGELPDYVAAIEQAFFDSTPKPVGWVPKRTLRQHLSRRVPQQLRRILHRKKHLWVESQQQLF